MRRITWGGSLALPLCLAACLCASVLVGAEEVVVRPRGNDAVLLNPGMGWIYYDYGDFPYDFPEARYVMLSRLWSEMEPLEGARRWDELKRRIDSWAAKGKQCIVRIMNTYSGVEYATPKWVFDAGVPWREFYNSTVVPGGGKEPFYWHPVFREKLRAFIADFGRTFDGYPGLFAVEIRNYGWWGEWHSTISWPTDVNKRAVLMEFIDMYADAFPTTPLVQEAAREYSEAEDYYVKTGIDHGIERGAMLRRDGFGGFLAYNEIKLLLQNWKRTRLLAEFAGSYSMFKDQRAQGFTPKDVVESVLDLHVSMASLGWGNADAYRFVTEDPALVASAAKRMGYRFILEEAAWNADPSPGMPLNVRTRWRNAGNAKCYERYPLTAFLLDPSRNVRWQARDERFDQRGWIEGGSYDVVSSFVLPTDLSPGEYTLCLAMVDDNGVPAIALAIDGDDGSRRYPMGTLRVRRRT